MTAEQNVVPLRSTHAAPVVFGAGAAIGVLGGMTMSVAFARYSRDGSFAVLGANLRFTAVMAVGSTAGAVLGGLLLGVFPDLVLIPAPAVILLVSAAKLARHA
ncbi:hypothetical protein ABZT27_30135 [Streptomyces sp. NPDC005389]|uniref:hypothetical protein n=1 Tax=Streptomyces sp. NPDC005389 TaxID=3157040 RepID=UPI00339DE606